MIKSRVKKKGMKRIVFDNSVDPRTGKKAVIEVPASLDAGHTMQCAREDAEEYAKRFHERVRGV